MTRAVPLEPASGHANRTPALAVLVRIATLTICENVLGALHNGLVLHGTDREKPGAVSALEEK